MGKLTDKEIRTWIKNDDRFEAKGDGDGLWLRYRESDKSPVWFMRFKIAKIEQKLIIGRYPDMTLAAARKTAQLHRLEIIKGHNPSDTKREVKRAVAAKAIAEQSAQTVAELVDEWFVKKIDGKMKSAYARRLSINKYLLPAIGKLKIEAVQPRHIIAMLDKTKEVAPTTANDLLTWSKQIFNYAIKQQIITNNPVAAFSAKEDAGGTESSRDRYLTHKELTLLFDAMRRADKFTKHHYQALKLLMLLGCRKSELLTAKRSAFDMDKAIWHMSLDNKTKSALDIPLVSPVVEILRELLSVQIDSSEYLFPAMGVRTSKQGHIDVGYLNKPIKELVFPLMDVEPFTLHDLRATMRTHLTSNAIGIDRFVAERCLNHKIPNMDGVYDRGDYFEERRQALEKWAAFLQTAEDGISWNVTPIRRAV